MHKRLLQISFIGLVLIVGAVACGPFAGTSAPTAQPPAAVSTAAAVATPAGQGEGTAQPTPTSTTGAASAPTSAAAVTPGGVAVGQTRAIKNASGGLDKLKSYRAHATYAFDGKDKTGQPRTGSLDYTRDVINATQDDHLKVAFTGDAIGDTSNNKSAGTPGGVEMYKVGGNQFLINGGKCQFIGSGISSTTPNALFSLDTFVGTDKATVVGRGELVNGIISDHYTFTETAIGTSLNGMKLVKGDAWVAWDGYLVKVVAQAAGKVKDGSEGTVNVNYSLESVNNVSPIIQPADCVVPVAVVDVPVPPNATEKKVYGAGGQTITTFKSPDPIKAVADFYRQSMPGQGWQATGDKANGATSIQLTYTKDAGKRTLMANVISQSGVTSVIITDQKSP